MSGVRSPSDEKTILQLRKELIHYKWLAEERKRSFDPKGWRNFKMYQEAMNRLHEMRKKMNDVDHIYDKIAELGHEINRLKLKTDQQKELIKQQRAKINDLEAQLDAAGYIIKKGWSQ